MRFSSQAATLSVAALAIIGLAGAHPAQAQNLVTNGGFETGDFTGWSISGPHASVDALAGVGGSYAASLGAIAPNQLDTLSQSLITSVGTTYTITFEAQTPEYGGLFNSTGQPNHLSVSFGGNVLAAVDVPDSVGYKKYTYTATATSKSTNLEFDVTNQPDFTQLDNIRVVATPEPSSVAAFALTGLGAAGLALTARRRRIA